MTRTRNRTEGGHKHASGNHGNLILIVVLALVLFGGGKLAGVGKALGKSIKDFKNEVKDDKAEEKSKEDKKDET